uniref:Mos1 transposase HTH domain-containing protein n=1 Tax=Acrobeloides nanus TaxID=290746 RepID=A0A914EI77_9BILA
MDNINRAKGPGTVKKTTAYEWFSKFKNNQMDIADKKRSGRPREVDRAAVVNAAEAHPSMTTQPSKKCARVLRNSLILRTENGTAMGFTGSKNNGRK